MYTLQQVDSKSILISHVSPNPSLSECESVKIPWTTTHVISLGGGSTIDFCKWLAEKYKLHHTAIPTTAGTGSEVTKYCVLMVEGKKVTFDLKEPDSYILNPKLVTTLPELQTLSTGLDALCQAMEAMWSKNATQNSQNYAMLAVDLVTKNLKLSMANPLNEIYRMNMLLAANFSGRAINITRTNVCHAISYPLTEIYGIPHGIACAMSLRYFAKKMENINYEELDAFFMGFNLPKYKVDREKIADIVIQNPKLQSYPHPITRDEIIKSIV